MPEWEGQASNVRNRSAGTVSCRTRSSEGSDQSDRDAEGPVLRDNVGDPSTLRGRVSDSHGEEAKGALLAFVGSVLGRRVGFSVRVEGL